MSEIESEVYPIERSLGGDNTHYVACEFRERQQNYAICLNVIKAFDEKRRRPEDTCCSEIKKKICPALAMRKEEISAGHTLYYMPRKKVEVVAKIEDEILVTPNHIKRTDGYQRGWQSAGAIIKGGKDKSIKNPQIRVREIEVSQDRIDSDGYAQMIGQMVRDHTASVKDTPKEVVKVIEVDTSINSESVLEKARRIRQQREALK